MRIAVLDDYQGVALASADWSAVQARAQVDVFHQAMDLEQAAEALADYNAICLMRERMPVPASLLDRLPKLKLIVVTGGQNRTLDLACATRNGVVVSHTPFHPAAAYATPELTWGLLLAAARNIPAEDASVRAGGWQTSVGTGLFGKTLGVVGLGRVGARVAHYGKAFGMEVIAWSQNLTDEKAAAAGAVRVDKDELFARSDAVSLHLVLSERSQGIVSARELGLMKPGAILVNTSRGPLVDEAALIAALSEGRIRAALDVYDHEPLPPQHSIRSLAGAVLTPHLGYVSEQGYSVFYGGTVEALTAYLDGAPIRLLNPEVAPRAASPAP